VSTPLLQLAELVRGTLHGDPNLAIHAAHTLTEAQAGDITFLENKRHAAQLEKSPAAAVVVPQGMTLAGKSVIQVADPIMAFAAIVAHLQHKHDCGPTGIDPRAYVHETATIGPEPSIAPFAALGAGTVVGARCRIHSGAVVGQNCKLGDDVVLYANAVLYDDTVVGDRAIVHANAVLGADGFGFRFQGGRHVKVPQLGQVEVGDDVEIGACTTIDRGTFTATRIGAGTKIDNLVQVAHNCQVGKHNLFVSQMGIAGSSTTGDYVVIAGQVGISDHVHIGTGAMIGAKAGVARDIAAGQRMLGVPATPEGEQKRILMSLEKLPGIRRDVRRIKQQLGMQDDEAA
jgi:UDP-3-O-[3-hydroxymyristoyl] glucosamine N-acyltransferase